MTIVVPPATPESGGSIVDYTSLQSAIAGWLHRSLSDAVLADAVPSFVQFAENRICRDLRIRAMETSLSATISAGVIAVPSGYVELKNAYVNGSPVRWLSRKDAEWIYANYPTRSAEGTPNFIAREAGNFIFGPYPDYAYTINGIYYQRPDPLSALNTTSWLITDAPDLLLFASLCEAEPWLLNDPRVVLWEKKYAQIKDRMQRADDDETFSGSPLAATVR